MLKVLKTQVWCTGLYFITDAIAKENSVNKMDIKWRFCTSIFLLLGGGVNWHILLVPGKKGMQPVAH